jgi:Domain of unknown function (DUF4157)
MVQYKSPSSSPLWDDNSEPLWNTSQPSNDSVDQFGEDPSDTFAFLKRQKNKKKKPKATQPDETPTSTDATPPKGNPEEDAETLFGLPLEQLKSRVGSADSQKERDADTLAEAATTHPATLNPSDQPDPTGKNLPAPITDAGPDVPGLPKHGGTALPKDKQAQFEQTVGNLEDVQVHKAPKHAKALGAEAFTLGRHIYMGQHATDATLSHEVAHFSPADKATKKIRRKAVNNDWMAQQAELARQKRIAAAKVAEAKRIAAEKAAAKRTAEARAQKLAVINKLKRDSQRAVQQQSRAKKLEQVRALKDKALREQESHRQRKVLQATLTHHPGLKTFGNGALTLGKQLLNPTLGTVVGAGSAGYAKLASSKTEADRWIKRSFKQGQHLFQQATHFNADPHLQTDADSGAAAFRKQTPHTQSPLAPSKSTAALQTQPQGWWETVKAAVKPQVQADFYGTNLVPQAQQNGLKTGLEWAQHQYQGAQQQGKTGEAQLRQSSVGKVVAPAWDASQNFEQQKTTAVRGFARGIDPTIRSWTDTAYDFLDKPLKQAEEQTKNIPIVGGMTQAANTFTRAQMQVGTGAVKFAGGFVGGLASLAADPGAAAKGLLTIAEHVPPAALIPSFMGGPMAGKVLNQMGVPMVNPLKAMHGAYDVVVNGQDYNSRMRDRVFNPKTSMAEDANVFKAVGNGLIEPMKQSWEQGKYVEAVTQGGLEIASWFVGAGEAKAGSKLGEASKLVSEAEKAGTIGNKVADASKATKIAEGVKGAEAAKTNQEIGGASKILRDEAGLKLTPERLQMRKNGEALQKSLPKRQQVPVEVDPALHGNTV